MRILVNLGLGALRAGCGFILSFTNSIRSLGTLDAKNPRVSSLSYRCWMFYCPMQRTLSSSMFHWWFPSPTLGATQDSNGPWLFDRHWVKMIRPSQCEGPECWCWGRMTFPTYRPEEITWDMKLILGVMLMGMGPRASVLEGVHSGLKVIRDPKHRLFLLQAHQDAATGSLQC